MITVQHDLPLVTFPIHNDGATPPVYDTLVEGQLIKVGSDGAVTSATAGVAHGTFQGKLEGTQNALCRLFGITARMIQSEAITCGLDVMQDSGAATKVKPAASGGTVIGAKVAPATTGSAGDYITVVLGGTHVLA